LEVLCPLPCLLRQTAFLHHFSTKLGDTHTHITHTASRTAHTAHMARTTHTASRIVHIERNTSTASQGWAQCALCELCALYALCLLCALCVQYPLHWVCSKSRRTQGHFTGAHTITHTHARMSPQMPKHRAHIETHTQGAQRCTHEEGTCSSSSSAAARRAALASNSFTACVAYGCLCVLCVLDTFRMLRVLSLLCMQRVLCT
jgi:hypothetical protein